jgi:hypothetical protein
MPTFTCPDGHNSTSSDWCDVCGAPIASSSGAAAPRPLAPPSGATPASKLPSPAQTRVCPNCQDTNPDDALFCESCGYDFTTDQLPQANSLSLSAPPSPSGNTAGTQWVAEQWIDPDWYAVNGHTSPDPCPTPGLPRTILLRTNTALIGRVSTSKSIHPDIDCSTDTGVSRRQAQLTCDNDRWYIEDLASTNGTYIGASGAGIPTDPVAPGRRIELDDDDRVYVGAWTRLVVRHATDAEKGL